MSKPGREPNVCIHCDAGVCSHVEIALAGLRHGVETWKDRAEINGKRAFELQDEIADLRAKLAARERVMQEMFDAKPKRGAYGLYYHFNTINQIKAKIRDAIHSGTPSDKGDA